MPCTMKSHLVKIFSIYFSSGPVVISVLVVVLVTFFFSFFFRVYGRWSVRRILVCGTYDRRMAPHWTEKKKKRSCESLYC